MVLEFNFLFGSSSKTFVLILAFVCTLLNASVWAQDYDPHSDAWNGLSDFLLIASQNGFQISIQNTLDYQSLDLQQPIFLLYPNRTLHIRALESFLAKGGRMLLADDFGQSKPLIQHLGLQPIPAPLDRCPHFHNNPQLPILTPLGHHPLIKNVQTIVANHPIAYQSKLPAVVFYPNTHQGFLYDLTVGKGKLILMADPSIYINEMLPIADNEILAINTLKYLAPKGSKTIELFIGTSFKTQGISAAHSQTSWIQKFKRILKKIQRVLRDWNKLSENRQLWLALELIALFFWLTLMWWLFPHQAHWVYELLFEPSDQSQEDVWTLREQQRALAYFRAFWTEKLQLSQKPPHQWASLLSQYGIDPSEAQRFADFLATLPSHREIDFYPYQLPWNHWKEDELEAFLEQARTFEKIMADSHG